MGSLLDHLIRKRIPFFFYDFIGLFSDSLLRGYDLSCFFIACTCVLFKVPTQLIDSQFIFRSHFHTFTVFITESVYLRAEWILLVARCELLGQLLDLIRKIELVMARTGPNRLLGRILE